METKTPSSLGPLDDVTVDMVVEIGRTNMKVKDLTGLRSGSVITFDKEVGQPMDVLISDRLMARGEVIVITDHYGIRLSEVTRPNEQVGDYRS